MASPSAIETDPEDPTLFGIMAGRLRMTEGQLYTAFLAVILALLLTLTGLPNAHRRSGSSVPTAPAAPTTQTGSAP